jgi:DNA-binding transcriptional LysR family regulator
MTETTLDLRISLQKLEVLLNVVRLGGVGRAAEAMYVAQPAVTGHIRSLEERLGAKLFYREGHRMLLTTQGRTVHRWAEEVLRLTAEVDRELSGLSAGSLGSAAIGAGPAVGSYILPPALARYRERHPGAEISLSVGRTEQVIEEVRRGDLDFAVVVAEPGPELPGMVMETIGSEETVLVCSPDWAPCSEAVTLAELPTLPLIEMPEGALHGGSALEQLRAAGVERAEVVLELGHPEAAKRAVRDGLGLAMLPRSSVREELESGALLEVPAPELRHELPLALVRRRDREPTALQKLLVEEIVAAIAASLSSPEPALALVG